jgi:uncharacterized protein (DUF1778 family)
VDTKFARAPAAGKGERLYLRTTHAQKDALTQAARVRHLPTTEFVLQASLSAAEEVLAQEERITLTQRDFARFVELIEHPEPPTQGLRDLMDSYGQLKTQYPEANL